MCLDPVSLILGAAQAVVSFGAAQQDYDNKAAQWKQNYTNSLAAGRDEQKQLSLRMLQEGEANDQKVRQNAIEKAEISSQAEASAAGAGVSGVSLKNIIHGIGKKINDKVSADETNYSNTITQLGAQMKATNTTITNRINSMQRPTAPNPLGYALQAVGGAIK